MNDKQNIKRALKQFFRKKNKILFCYLFGSALSEDFIFESDVDVAIYFKKSKYKDFFKERLKLISQLSKILHREADVIILNTAPPFLKYVILTEGELIFEKAREQRIDFELKTINEYIDFRPVLEKYYQRILTA